MMQIIRKRHKARLTEINIGGSIKKRVVLNDKGVEELIPADELPQFQDLSLEEKDIEKSSIELAKRNAEKKDMMAEIMELNQDFDIVLEYLK